MIWTESGTLGIPASGICHVFPTERILCFLSTAIGQDERRNNSNNNQLTTNWQLLQYWSSRKNHHTTTTSAKFGRLGLRHLYKSIRITSNILLDRFISTYNSISRAPKKGHNLKETLKIKICRSYVKKGKKKILSLDNLFAGRDVDITELLGYVTTTAAATTPKS